MRCPKCHYLSFDPEPRCKNCGYDLEVADTDLALRTAESDRSSATDDSLPDLTLRERPSTSAPITLELGHYSPEPAQSSSAPEPVAAASRLVLVEEPPAVVEPPRVPKRAPHTTTTDLPLFLKGIPEPEFPDETRLGSRRLIPHDPPPIVPPMSARPPLGVRRGAPEQPRARHPQPERRLGPLDRDLLEDLKRVEREEVAQARAEARAIGAANHSSTDSVPVGDRVAALAVDTAVLGGIAGFVLWATLRLCAVSLADLGPGVLVPLIAFLVLMDLGYLLMLTAAGGQTVGKMLMHIRVVGDDDTDHVSLRQAAWRAVVAVMGLGLGWLPALFGRGLALHDRLAHTRVVRE